MFADLKSAFRQLAKSPGFTVVALLTLALGIGATTVTFSLVHAVLLRPFPARDPQQLVALNEINLAQDFARGMSISYPDFVDWRRDSRTLAAVALYEDASYTLAGDTAAAEHLDGATATAGLFELFGAVPELGRTFRVEEESPSGARVAVLSHETWTRRFHADPAVLGRTLRLDGEPHTIIGVMPAGFRFPDNAALWTPIRLAVSADERGSHSFDGVGRLKAGVTLAQARDDLNAIAVRLAQAFPGTNAQVGVLARPFLEQVTGNYGRVVLTLFGAVSCLLLLTCVNLGGLLLARGAAREREMAVRSALGASRLRIVRQLLVENLVLGLAGGAAGALLAAWGLGLLTHVLRDDLPYWMQFSLDRPVLAFACALSVLVSLGFGVVPAWQLSRVSLSHTLKEGGRSGSAARSSLLRAFAGAQLTLALILLASAGLLVKSLLRLQSVRPGFEAGGVLTFSLALPHALYPDEARQIAAVGRLVERLQVVPGAESAAFVSNLPLGHSNWGRGFTIVGRPPFAPGQNPVALNRVVSADYFRALRIPVRRGRAFTPGDTAASPRVAIIDESFARKYFPHENPLGQRLHYGQNAKNPTMEIVGVVGDVRHYDLQNSTARPGLYVPATQFPSELGGFFVLRTAGDPASLASSATAAVAAVDRELAVADLQPMSDRVRDSIWTDRLVDGIFAGFAAVALLLAALGVYGVTAFATSQRTREIGVRMALGAQPGDVLRLVLGGGMRLAALALGLGLAAALALTRLLAAQLYEVDPRDPAVFAGVTLLLAAIALLACWLPARRATKVDPLIALRTE